jgi:hypothetical protein
MSRSNRHRAMQCVAGPGSWLTPGDKLALVLIGDLVSDEDYYWEAQENLGERMGVSRRSAGRAVRKLVEYDALRFLGWRRTGAGATVKAFAFEPEMLTEMGETFTPDMGAALPPHTETDDGQVGTSVHPGGKNTTPTWEETRHEMGSNVPQTGREPEDNREENRHKVAPPAQLLPPTDTDPNLETERQRQLTALEEMAHASG